MTNKNASTYIEAKIYQLIFHIHYGPHDERYKNYESNIIKTQSVDSNWIQLFVYEYTHLF
jgi:hypothetical protein